MPLPFEHVPLYTMSKSCAFGGGNPCELKYKCREKHQLGMKTLENQKPKGKKPYKLSDKSTLNKRYTKLGNLSDTDRLNNSIFYFGQFTFIDKIL